MDTSAGRMAMRRTVIIESGTYTGSFRESYTDSMDVMLPGADSLVVAPQYGHKTSRTAMSYPAIPDMAHPIHSDAFIDTNWQSAFRNLTNNNLYHSHKSTLSHPQCPHKPSPTMHAQTSSFVTRILQRFKSSSSSRLSRRESIMSDSTTAYLYLQTSDCQSTSSTGVASKDYASAFALLQSSYGVGGNVSMHFTKSNTRRSRNKP